MSSKKGKSSLENDSARLKESRLQKITQLDEAISNLEKSLQQCRTHESQRVLLDSVSLGLYEEIDKLSKKAPAERLTDLALKQSNDIIRETKQLIDIDPYIQRLEEFVPAGDNPEHRDAVIVLRQIRQGLERYHNQLDSQIKLSRTRLNDAKGIKLVIQLSLENDDNIKAQDLQEYGVHISSEWFSEEYPRNFKFTMLERINIPEYFMGAVKRDHTKTE